MTAGIKKTFYLDNAASDSPVLLLCILLHDASLFFVNAMDVVEWIGTILFLPNCRQLLDTKFPFLHLHFEEI
jgi:hypothetical protein